MRPFLSFCIVTIFFMTAPCFAAAGPRAQFLAQLPPASLVLFYSVNCPPCHAEINALPQLVQAAGGWNFAIATLSKPDPALMSAAASQNVRVIDISNGGAYILQSFNHNRLALPFAFATGLNGKVCGKQSGLLGTKRIASWRRRCSL